MDSTPCNNHPQDGIPCPDDALFKRNFAHKEFFSEFLDHVLPPELIKSLDKETLVIEPTSFVDKEHRDHISDISATIQLCDHKTHVYLLMEHKSYNDPMALLQILRYMQLKWTGEVEEAKGKKVSLTPIIPILFHHGSNKNPPVRFIELFDKSLPEMLKGYQPDFLAALYNLTTTPDEKLEASPGLSATLWALKYSRTDITKIMQAYMEKVKIYGEKFLHDPAFLSVKVYILKVCKESPEEIKRRYLDTLNSPELQEAFMSTADMLIEQGIEQGMQKGIQAKAIETARKMLDSGFEFSMISQITGLTEEALIEIRDTSR